MKYEHKGDTVYATITSSDPLRALQQTANGLKKAIKELNNRGAYHLCLLYKCGPIVLDEMGLGTLLRHYSDSVHPFFKQIFEILEKTEKEDELPYRNEMVPLGLDLLSSYLTSLYQNYEGTDKQCAELLRKTILNY